MNRYKVLVIDNDSWYRNSVKNLLEPEYEVLEASNRRDAHRILRSEIVHLAIIDVRLGNDDVITDTSGLTLCDEIDPIVGKLVVTGYTDDWHVIRTALDPAKRMQKQGSADGFFSKEWDPSSLLLEEVLRILKDKFEIIPKRRIAVLTSGGEAPGMNAAIWSIVRTAMNNDIEVLGVQEGYRGLAEDQMIKLSWNRVSAIMAEGGTILQSARCKEFKERDYRSKAVENVIRKQISGLIVIGGDGSMRGAMALAEDLKSQNRDLATFAIPGTIDNDLWGTDLSLGATSAANSMVELVRNMIAPAQALRRIFIVEVMGAYCGYLALETAIGTGADAVVIPEKVVELRSDSTLSAGWQHEVDSAITVDNVKAASKEIAAQLERSFALGKTFSFIIFAEGVDLATRETIASQQLETKLLNGSYLKQLIEAEIKSWPEKNKPEVRVQNLGYPIRGVRPCSFDVWLGANLGEAAVNHLIDQIETNLMVGWSEQRGVITTKYEDVIAASNRPPTEIWQMRPSWREKFAIQQSLTKPVKTLAQKNLSEAELTG